MVSCGPVCQTGIDLICWKNGCVLNHCMFASYVLTLINLRFVMYRMFCSVLFLMFVFKLCSSSCLFLSKHRHVHQDSLCLMLSTVENRVYRAPSTTLNFRLLCLLLSSLALMDEFTTEEKNIRVIYVLCSVSGLESINVDCNRWLCV